MNATRMAQNAYGNDTHPIKTSRDIEYDAFARITRRLKDTSARGRNGFPDLAAAIHDNRRLWIILVTDIVDKNNPLAAELKARIMYLAEFTEVHSRRVLKGDAKVDPLIEVNTAVMVGLHPRRQSA
ncbi:flagellar biosynthesis regulator FlaF [Rhodobacteraceae bacterium KMM 6894]|nr:flagellar biosynthesis regulator FlaF [Rhodobacteraceae bacterium KMM 6894]